MSEPALHGLVAEFRDPSALLAAARAAREEGYREMDAYTPFPVEDLAATLGMRRTGVPLVTLLCGMGGGVGGYALQYYTAVWDYPLNVGGRPLHSWPAFIPIAFELTILSAALGAAFGMLALNRLPQLHHPIFETPFFTERNASRFYLCIEATNRRFHPEATRRFLREQGAVEVWEVPA